MLGSQGRRPLVCSTWRKRWTEVSPFLRAREEALKLREELIGNQAWLPTSSKDLLSRVEEIIGVLGIQEVPKSSGVLRGAKATLRRTEGFIYCRDDYDWPRKAYLIAHELGHFRLDPDVDEDDLHRDAEEFVPASPTAAYVEAYGARERDELQKNVFGRELLLPRQVARSMFLAGQGPRAIAKTLGIPLEVARQQVLDAVLLPPYVPLPPGPLPTPSADQRKAIYATEKHVHVVAGPGTGKTTTLVHRVKKLIEGDKVDPRKILVLTFTNKAAAELVDRLQRAGVKGASEIWAGTFHAFGLEFLRKYFQHFGVSQDVAVADKISQLTLTARALASAHLEFYKRTDDPYEWLPPVLETVLRVKEELVPVDEYLAAALDTTDDDIERARFRDVATVARAYVDALQERGVVDFVDLVAKPAQAIAADRAKFTDVADRYEHVLVDEFQDLTSAMLAMTAELSRNAQSLWVVGDVRQAIYQWRGASLDALLGFKHRFARARRYDLVENRRSVQEVIALTAVAGEVHPLQDDFPLTEARCKRGYSERAPVIYRSTSRPAMWTGLADNIRRDLRDGIPLRNQVVLARKSAVVAAAAKELKEAGIPVVYVGELIERQEVKDLLAFIQLVVERSPRALLRIGELVEPKMGTADVTAILQAVAADPSLHRAGWVGSSAVPLSPGGHASRRTLAKLMKGFSWSSSPWEFLCELLLEQRFLLADLNDHSIDGHLRRLAQWQFTYMARVGDGDRRRMTLFRLFHRVRLRQQVRDIYVDRELPPETNGLEGVRVLTVHGSKGLEFQAVHLACVNGRDFAGNDEENALLPPEAIGSTVKQNRFEAGVEKHNLLYVAVSRAKDAISIYENSEEFPFDHVVALEEAVRRGVLLEKDEARTARGKAASATKAASGLAPDFVSHEQLMAYDRCPRQYLYRFGIELGQELSPNPALQARSLVRRTLRQLAEANQYDRLAGAFAQDWEQARLPESSADPQLWAQAWAAAVNGATYLSGLNGKLLEASADVRRLRVGLPWGVAVGAPGGWHLHCVDFYSAAKTTRERHDKILGQLMHLTSIGGKVVGASLVDLSRGTTRDVVPIYVTERSLLSTRSSGLAGGDFNPSGDRYPCARCAYSYVCPSLPST
jgi:superfamily I DNA/RNA helicase/Zn-dependent peptidase ImmA (M78 family)